MAKSILISIKPRYVADILNHKKTIEVRKSMPKCDLPIDVYIYCTKDKERLVKHRLANGDISYTLGKEFSYYNDDLNGKVVAKFTLNKVEEISWQIGVFQLEQRCFSDFLNKCCLGFCELKNYLNKKNGYAWHISNLIIFDKPKELSEFKKLGYVHEVFALESHLMDIEGCNGGIDERYVKECYQCLEMDFKLTKAPQSWCYVEEEKD